MDKPLVLISRIVGANCELEVLQNEYNVLVLCFKFAGQEAKGEVVLEESPYGLAILDKDRKRSYGLIDMFHQSPASENEGEEKPEIQIIIDTNSDPAAYARFYKDSQIVEVDANSADEVRQADRETGQLYYYKWGRIGKG